MEYIEKAIRKIKEENWEEAYELLEYASLLEPDNHVPYLLKSVILNRKFWQQKLKYEELSGRKFSEFLDVGDF